ncbi:MAG: DivIVA domain-containing protein [Ignavibacteriales bacterium]|nr:DivIVA domain-containing protein [Ignavibacteriales bacterium]
MSIKKIEKNLQDTLLKAQESSAKSMEAAKKQSALMIKRSRIKSFTDYSKKHEESTNEIRNAVVNLKRRKRFDHCKAKSNCKFSVKSA